MLDKQILTVEKYLLDNPYRLTPSKGGLSQTVWMDKGNDTYLNQSGTGCNYAMDRGEAAGSPVVGIPVFRYEQYDKGPYNNERAFTKEGEAYIEWLADPKSSVYRPLIKFMGDKFKVVRDKEGHIAGFIFIEPTVNASILMAFVMSSRSIRESPEMVKTWYEFVTKYDAPPSLAYLLSGFYNANGDRRTHTHHALANDELHGKVAIHRFINIDHEDWELKKKQHFKGHSYHPVVKTAWAGKFDMFRDIPIVTPGNKPKTFFHWRYDPELKPNGLSSLSIKNFFDNHMEITKNYV